MVSLINHGPTCSNVRLLHGVLGQRGEGCLIQLQFRAVLVYHESLCNPPHAGSGVEVTLLIGSLTAARLTLYQVVKTAGTLERTLVPMCRLRPHPQISVFSHSHMKLNIHSHSGRRIAWFIKTTAYTRGRARQPTSVHCFIGL